MTTDTGTVAYKREPVPAIGGEEVQKTYVSDELQRIEDTLNNHGRVATHIATTVDGNKGVFDQYVVTQAGINSSFVQSLSSLSATSAADDSTNSAAITEERSARIAEDTAQALLITTLTGSIAANVASIVAVQGAYADADSAQTRVINTQRALFGAAVSDNWELGHEYIGSLDTSVSPSVATGDDVVVGGYIYRCRVTHVAQDTTDAVAGTTRNKPPNSAIWELVLNVDGKIAAGVTTASGAHASAGYALATDLSLLTGRVAANEGLVGGIGTNAGDIVTANRTIALHNSVHSRTKDLVSARFGVTVADNYDSTYTYPVGDFVIHNNLVYECIQIALTKLPSLYPLYWQFVDTIAAEVAAAVTTERDARTTAQEALARRTDIVSARLGIPDTPGSNWDSTKLYAIGDEVVHSSGKVYKAAAVPPVGTVPTNTSYWVEQSLLYATVATTSQALANLDGTVSAKYGVTLDANGYVSGFESTNDGTTAIFQIAADKFSIRTPSTDSIPFEVDGNVVRMQNVEIGNNVIGLNSITHPHHATVTTAYASTLNSFTEVGSLAFTPTAAGEVLFVVNFNNAAVTASNQVTASARVDYSIQLRLTVGSGSEFSMQGMNLLRVGGILTGHFGNSFLRTLSSSVINQLHTFKVYAKPTGFVSGAAKLGIYNLSMSATELYR